MAAGSAGTTRARQARDGRQPLVAVGYGPRCVPVLLLAEAAAGLCDLLWLIDRRLPVMAQMDELLRRVGSTVDIGGLDGDAVAEAAAPFEPDALVTFLDEGMVELAGAAERLGLPFHSPAAALALTDKARQRELLAAAGLPGPTCRIVPAGTAPEAAPGIADGLVWPAILKPRSAQGSSQTFLAPSPADAVRLLASLGPDRRDMVLEDYLPGDPDRASSPYADYLSVESLVAGGAVSHLAVTGRFPMADNFRETGFFIPAALDPDERASVLDLAGRAVDALGVTTGCLHTEMKLTPDGPRLIEVNGRVGGGVPEMLERAAGFSVLEHGLRVALGETVQIHGPVATERVGYRFFLQPPAMTAMVRTIDGVDVVSDYPGVDGVSVHRGPGAAFDWRDGTRNYILAVVGSARDYDELLAVDRLLHHEVMVSYSEAHH